MTYLKATASDSNRVEKIQKSGWVACARVRITRLPDRERVNLASPRSHLETPINFNYPAAHARVYIGARRDFRQPTLNPAARTARPPPRAPLSFSPSASPFLFCFLPAFFISAIPRGDFACAERDRRGSAACFASVIGGLLAALILGYVHPAVCTWFVAPRPVTSIS